MKNPVSSVSQFPDVPCKQAELQAPCGLMDVQMWLSAVENERLIAEAFEVACPSYALFPPQQ